VDDWRSYDEVADVYERVHAPRFVDAGRDLIAELLVGADDLVLDVGSGTGAVAAAAVATGARVVGVDRSLPMLAAGRRTHPDLRLAAAEAIDLPFRDRTFDVVIGNFVLAHFAKVETALFDVVRVLRPGGRVGFSSWADGQDAFQNTWLELVESVVPRDMLAPAYAAAAPGHDRFTHADEVEEALRDAGFRHVRSERRRYHWTYPREDLVEGLGTWTVGRFVHQMLGEDGWAALLQRARATFAERFPNPLNDFRDVILAVGSLPS
jgi:ubiquinone/menaquinone biosynthesis C-methylase UbiE